MTDRQWKAMQEELKPLQPGHQDGPDDPVAFKERVLAEYERRTRWELRTRWLRRGMAAAAVCAAAWVGMVFTGPYWHADPSTFKEKDLRKSAAVHMQNLVSVADSTQSAPDACRQFFNLLLQKRPDEAKLLLASDLEQQPLLVSQNASNPHMTGFDIQEDGDNRYRVNVQWGTYGAETMVQAYEVTMQQQAGRWVISSYQHLGDVDVEGNDGQHVRLTNGVASHPQVIMNRQDIPEKEDWAFFTLAPTNNSAPLQLLFAVKAEQPVLYTMQQGSKPKRLAQLPAGQIGEVLWSEKGWLVMNFSPKSESNYNKLLAYDATTGQPLNIDWLNEELHQMGFADFHVVHVLPGGDQIRVRAGATSLIADLSEQQVQIESEGHPPLEQVKYDGQSDRLPDNKLALYYADQLPQDSASLNIPPDRRLDPKSETGLYVVNGSVQAFALVDNQLQIELSLDKGRVQEVALPFALVKKYAGRTILIRSYDESGKEIGTPRNVRVPD